MYATFHKSAFSQFISINSSSFNSIVEYIQRVRIEAAKMTLEKTRENVNEAMYKVGYTDSKAFRTTFKKITGLSPLQYRSKYNREMMPSLVSSS